MDITQKTMKFALSIKLQLLFNFIINIMLKLVIYINGLLLAYKQWGVGDKYANKYSIATLPIAFSNVDYALMITNRNLSSGIYISGAALSTTQIKVWNGGYSDRYYFFAIGW